MTAECIPGQLRDEAMILVPVGKVMCHHQSWPGLDHEQHSHAGERRRMMMRLKPDLPADGTILCLGAHCDDIEIGCGGTLIEPRERRPRLRFVWVVFSGDTVRERETRAAAAALLGAGANVTVDVHHFRGSYFPYCGADIKDAFEAVRSRVAPDL